MEKWLCWSAMGVSGFLLLLFPLDIFGLLACAGVLYLGWDALRDLR
jgi:hypothetical protein